MNVRGGECLGGGRLTIFPSIDYSIDCIFSENKVFCHIVFIDMTLIQIALDARQEALKSIRALVSCRVRW